MPRTDPTMHGVGTTHLPRKRHADRPEPAGRPERPTAPGGHDERDDRDEDFELERDDPTFAAAPPVPKGDVDVPDVGDERVAYGADAKDRKQSKSTFDPSDVDDDSQGI